MTGMRPVKTINERIDALLGDGSFLKSHASLYLKNNHHRKRLTALLDTTVKYGPETILEIGGSDGLLAKLIMLELGGKVKKYYFAELDGTNLSYARKNLSSDNVEFLKFDVCKDDIGQRGLDLIICSEVLEHVLDYEKALHNIIGAMSERVIVSTPNERFLAGFAKNVFRKFRRRENIPSGFLARCLFGMDMSGHKRETAGGCYPSHAGFDNLKFERNLRAISSEHYGIRKVAIGPRGFRMCHIYELHKRPACRLTRA